MIVSCAVCPDGFTSKLTVSSDFLPPLQLAIDKMANKSEQKQTQLSLEAIVGVVSMQHRSERWYGTGSSNRVCRVRNAQCAVAATMTARR